MRESLWHEHKINHEGKYEAHLHPEVGWNQSPQSPAGKPEGLDIDGSGNANSLSLIFLLFLCLHLRNVTSAHDKEQNLVAFVDMGQAMNFWPSGGQQVKEIHNSEKSEA